MMCTEYRSIGVFLILTMKTETPSEPKNNINLNY